MSRKSLRIFAALTIVLMITLSDPHFAIAAPQPQPGVNGWWDQSYLFRRSLTLSNPSPQPIVNQPYLMEVTFPTPDLLDARTELRLINSTGGEVPSYVVDQVSSGGFVTSAWLLVIASLKASSNGAFMLYYGNPGAPSPSYRTQTQARSFTAGLYTVGQLASHPGSTAQVLSYGGTYQETVLSKLSLSGSSGGEFGTSEIATRPLSQVFPWQAIANMSLPPTYAVATTSVAGEARLTTLSVVSGGGVLTTYLVQNIGSSALPQVRITAVVEASQLATIDPASTQYTTGSSVLLTKVGPVSVGMEATLGAAAFDVGPTREVVNYTRADRFLSRASGFGDVATALAWSLGDIQPGSFKQLGILWGTSSSSTALLDTLAAVHFSPTYAVGEEQTLQKLLPTADLFWGTQVALDNVSASASGLSLPLTIGGGGWLPASASFSGKVHAFVPSPDFSPGHQGPWTGTSHITGNATALASGSFWSVQDSLYVGRTSVTTLNATSTGISQLSSATQTVFGDPSPQLIFHYRASFAGVGVIGNQTLFAAVDLDHTFSGTPDQRLLFPVFGSSTQRTTCSADPRAPQPPVNSTIGGFLVADGTWRTLGFNLGTRVRPSGFTFQIHFCTSISKGFVGSMKLDMTSSGVSVKLSGSGVVDASLGFKSPSLGLALGPQYGFMTSGVVLDGVVSFVVAQRYQMQDVGGTLFVAQARGFPIPSVNGSSSSTRGIVLTAASAGIRVSTHYTGQSPSLSVNGATVGGSSLTLGSIFAPGLAISKAWGNLRQGASVGIKFVGVSFRVVVHDANKTPVQGVNVTVGAGLPYAVNSAITDTEGSVSFGVVPWTYNLTATFQGSLVAASSLAVSQNTNAVLDTNILRAHLQVKDSRGSPLPGVLVSGTSGVSGNFVGITDSSGTISFQAPANTAYHVTVSSGGTTYYTGSIMVSVNNGLISVQTNYVSTNTVIAVVVVVIIVGLVSWLAATLLLKRDLLGRRKL
ncbi:MAG: carboxypeptidase-like regulatory domain-containing protein [Thaumarchaeota archaeon]|nr:carboxypeptidase-like regulatory domain-containing protein [Nitrososphaerota archaeon]